MMHYVVSKAAVVGFSRVLARELGPFNIRVNTLAPGSTASEPEPTEAALKDYEQSRGQAHPENASSSRTTWWERRCTCFSELSAFVTGQSILVNGGANLH